MATLFLSLSLSVALSEGEREREARERGGVRERRGETIERTDQWNVIKEREGMGGGESGGSEVSVGRRGSEMGPRGRGGRVSSGGVGPT